jgi:hypothetical protein
MTKPTNAANVIANGDLIACPTLNLVLNRAKAEWA